VHWEIAAKGSRKLHDFYARLVDWNANVDGATGYGAQETDRQGEIGGGIMPVRADYPPHVTLYVQVDDLQAHLDKAEYLGAKTVAPPTPIPNAGSFAMFHDPEGDLIGLVKGQTT
jgi:predicted enzyme related to lactoylglutathione lyase